MAAVLIILPFCSDGSIVGCWLRHLYRHIRLRRCCRCRCSPPPSPPPSSPPLRHVTLTLGDGACEKAHNHNRIGQGRRSISSGNGKKVKIHGILHCVKHGFYVKINPRQTLGDGVACTSVASMQLHRPIRHAGINIQRIIARQRRNGGGVLFYIIGIWEQLATSPVLGNIFRSAGRYPKK